MSGKARILAEAVQLQGKPPKRGATSQKRQFWIGWSINSSPRPRGDIFFPMDFFPTTRQDLYE